MGFVFYITESRLEEVVYINRNIPEFETDENLLDVNFFKERIGDKDHSILVAYVGHIPAGYVVSYELEDNSLYCWMAGVVPGFRRGGALSELMEKQFEWASVYEYDKVKIKTRNERREMLRYLVKNGFMIVGVEERDNVEKNRIMLEKVV